MRVGCGSSRRSVYDLTRANGANLREYPTIWYFGIKDNLKTYSSLTIRVRVQLTYIMGLGYYAYVPNHPSHKD
ncbi:MAG: hypothetical protein ACRKGH_06505 [Dehalogenimonas sp.]